MKAILFCLLFLLSYNRSKQIQVNNHDSGLTNFSNQLEVSYCVYKIDSIKNWYLIYATQKDSIYKIVSKKTVEANCTKVVSGKYYCFKLHSFTSRTLFGKEINPSVFLQLAGYGVDDSTIIRFEKDSINDLYYADNVKGLCFEN